MNQEFLCGLCIDPLRDPRVLPCGHVYCGECLVAHALFYERHTRRPSCPLCCRPFSLPSGSAHDLPPSELHRHFLHRLGTQANASLQKLPIAARKDKHPGLDPHTGLTHHKRESEISISSGLERDKCPKHRMRYTHVCLDCEKDQIICEEGVSVHTHKHPNHNIVPISAAEKTLQSRLDTMIPKIEKRTEFLANISKSLDESITRLQESIEEARGKSKECFAEFRQILDEMEKKVMMQLDHLQRDAMIDYEFEKRDIGIASRHLDNAMYLYEDMKADKGKEIQNVVHATDYLRHSLVRPVACSLITRTLRYECPHEIVLSTSHHLDHSWAIFSQGASSDTFDTQDLLHPSSSISSGLSQLGSEDGIGTHPHSSFASSSMVSVPHTAFKHSELQTISPDHHQKSIAYRNCREITRIVRYFDCLKHHAQSSWFSSHHHHLKSASALAVHPRDESIFVLDTLHKRIVVLSRDLEDIRVYDSHIAALKFLREPRRMAISPDGTRVAIVDHELHRVFVYTSNFEYLLTTIPQPSETDCKVAWPRNVAFDSHGHLYVTMAAPFFGGCHQISKFDSTHGKLMTEFLHPTTDTEIGPDFVPAGIVVNGRDEVLVIAEAGDLVVVFSADGRKIRSHPVQKTMDGWNSLAQGPDDGFVLSDFGGDRVSFYSKDGLLIQSIEVEKPMGPVFGLDARFYILTYPHGRVLMY
eukprot:TRINITY_DN10635_c0_g1_i1.p1 TRINITY_DN10635_c0_g1~~TRINITY_DN10635_c0_g1_i1.p1  ORF type:complete len:699 (+),score=134.39 TRINITY_DN10635_c0_g1_i1:64-2160(+)